MSKKVAVLVGSLRKESYNRKIALTLQELSSGRLNLQIVEIGQLPLYNQDHDDAPPASWVEFRQALQSFDSVLFITPEYNRSIPAVIKNAIDVGSRPYGKSVWNGKPGAIISASPGAIGGFGANHHLRQTLVFLNVPCMQQPEAYLGNVAGVFDEQGKITNVGTLEFLVKYLEAYADWVELHTHKI